MLSEQAKGLVMQMGGFFVCFCGFECQISFPSFFSGGCNLLWLGGKASAVEKAHPDLHELISSSKVIL